MIHWTRLVSGLKKLVGTLTLPDLKIVGAGEADEGTDCALLLVPEAGALSALADLTFVLTASANVTDLVTGARARHYYQSLHPLQ
jgi:hypothetical protein